MNRFAIAAVLAAPLLTTGCTDGGPPSGTDPGAERHATTQDLTRDDVRASTTPPKREVAGTRHPIDNNIAMMCPGGTGMRKAPYEVTSQGAPSPMLAARPFITAGPGAQPGDYGIPGPRRGNRVDILVIHRSYIIRHDLIVVRRHGQWFLETVKECASAQSHR